MQEEVEMRAVMLAVNGSKLTVRTLKNAIAKPSFCDTIRKKGSERNGKEIHDAKQRRKIVHSETCTNGGSGSKNRA